MKKLALTVAVLILSQTTFADDIANLRVKISGATADNRYFLCVGSAGCVSIKAGDEGKTYPINPGSMNYLYTTNVENMRLYTQELPRSCQVAVKENQTVTVTGHIVASNDQKVHIENLNCKVA